MNSKIHIRKYGQGMNSLRPSRRNLYIEISPLPETSLLEALRYSSGVLRNLVQLWSFDVSGLTAWYKYQPCQYCSSRQTYEQLKFENAEYFWRRMYCWRHYLIEHLSELVTDTFDFMENNRPTELQVDKSVVVLKLATNNYNYNITVNRVQALLECTYKNNRRFVFRYNNHAKLFPLMSSYLRILSIAVDILVIFVNYLDWVVRYALKPWTPLHYNLYVNGALIFKASESEGN